MILIGSTNVLTSADYQAIYLIFSKVMLGVTLVTVAPFMVARGNGDRLVLISSFPAFGVYTAGESVVRKSGLNCSDTGPPCC